MKIKLTNVYVDDQEKALRFYTEKLGFVKKADFSQGNFRWLTAVSPEEPGGVELVLQLVSFVPPAKTYQQALPAGHARRDVLRRRRQEGAREVASSRRDVHHAAHEDGRLDDHHAGRYLRELGPAHGFFEHFG